MMISVWPSFGNGTEIFKELDKKGALYPMVSSPREARVYDAFNPEARGIVWDYMNRYMFQLGMSAWWMDATEPEFYGAKQSDFNFQTKEGALRNVRNIYPLYTSKAIWDNQRATTLDKRVYILTRSAYIGSQRYGAGSWSGDIRASFDVFKKQIPAGLNFSICGIPYWNTDIGAWHPYGNVYNTAHKDPAYQQLYVRWFQFATFNPMMRSHGTGSPREIYQFGERGYWAFDVQEQYIKLRYSLLPYLYSTAWQVTKMVIRICANFLWKLLMIHQPIRFLMNLCLEVLSWLHRLLKKMLFRVVSICPIILSGLTFGQDRFWMAGK